MTSIQARIHAFETGNVKPVDDEEDADGWVAAPPIVKRPMEPAYTYPPPPPRSASKPTSSLKPTTTPTHTHTNSSSSFHSVNMDDDSFDNISASASTSTTGFSSFEHVSPVNEKPKLPERKPKLAPPPPPPYKIRQPSPQPPPPPRSGISVSKPNLNRPTPVPPAARARYLSVFDANIQVAKLIPPPSSSSGTLSPPRSRQGWRGLSVDLSMEPTLPEEVVKAIWAASRLPRSRLAQIWRDTVKERGKGVGRDAFVAGMWKIDEELRRRKR